ncbi:MAG TPA: TIGR03086 family metal-binding protein [Acidimicrobiales bacterium]|nr:TIGR03086 family metal-binding protein [Acidimicrobiales bacterium]
MSEAVDRYTHLADEFAKRVEATPDDRWDAPSPNPGWTARDVVAHIVDSQRRLVGALDGTEPETGIAAGVDPKAAWRESYAAVREALAQPANLEKQVPGPMGPMPVDMAVGRIASTDVLIHTWDLARATGGDEQLDADAVAHAYEGLKPLDAMIRRPGLFGDKVDVPEGADLQTEFLCFVGRKP